MKTKTGRIDEIKYTHNSFGQQLTTINGGCYVTCFDFLDKNLEGIGTGAMVEYTVIPGPTLLCNAPHVESRLPKAELTRVLHGKGA